jgi:hypothetical protein
VNQTSPGAPTGALLLGVGGSDIIPDAMIESTVMAEA